MDPKVGHLLISVYGQSYCQLYIFIAAFAYLQTKERNNAPHTPRVILLGPTGAGKREQASLLCSKYHLVHGKEIFHLPSCFDFY